MFLNILEAPFIAVQGIEYFYSFLCSVHFIANSIKRTWNTQEMDLVSLTYNTQAGRRYSGLHQEQNTQLTKCCEF